MKGDFTRFGFDSNKHFSRVLLQQGRVALDSDANESSAIVLHHLRTLTRDLFGAFGGPANGGFALSLDSSGKPPVLWIGPGHYYVDGILCENEAWLDYTQQSDYALAPPDASGAGGDELRAWLRDPVASQRFWVYLDVWERHVAWIEDDSIREPALGGADTCTRAKVVWQVKARPWNTDWGDFSSSNACGAPLPSINGPGTARMSARIDPGAAFTDPCVIPPASLYRGAENRLYRVEVHHGGGAAAATFKWSRDNGSVATRWLGSDGNVLVAKSGRGFAAGNWIELSHDALELAGQPGQLLRLSTVEGERLTIDAATIPSGGPMVWSSLLSNPKVRRWDQRANDDVLLRDGAVPVVESNGTQTTWIDLEDGVQISFAAGGEYSSGEFWVIPARVAAHGIEWPQDGSQPALRAPEGIVHRYAPLGTLLFNSDGIQLRHCRTCFGLSSVACGNPGTPPRVTDGPIRRNLAAAAPSPKVPRRKPAKRRAKPT